MNLESMNHEPLVRWPLGGEIFSFPLCAVHSRTPASWPAFPCISDCNRFCMILVTLGLGPALTAIGVSHVCLALAPADQLSRLGTPVSLWPVLGLCPSHIS